MRKRADFWQGRYVVCLAVIFSLILSAFVSCQRVERPAVGIQNSSPQIVSQVKHPVWSRNVSIYEVNVRQYSPQGTCHSSYRPGEPPGQPGELLFRQGLLWY
jgi:hypothetical protein